MNLWRVTLLAFGAGFFLYHIPAPDAHTARREAIVRAIRETGTGAEFRIVGVQRLQEEGAA